jgi:uncharacterized protein (DUF433 family)
MPVSAKRTVEAMKNGKPQLSHRSKKRIELGRYTVADPEICHGQPTIKGTRIMVWQVLDDVAEGRSWEFICNKRWGGRIERTAVEEALKLAQAV